MKRFAGKVASVAGATVAAATYEAARHAAVADVDAISLDRTSEDASFMAGPAIPVDGGRSIR